MTRPALTDRDLAQRLVEHAVSTRCDRLPADALAATRTFVLDTLGVALSGARVPMVATLKDAAARWGRGEGARIWGTGEPVPAQTAAFINGYQIHNQEWDCVHEPAVVHPMAVVLAALLALAEERGGVDGARLVAGCAVAVDVAATLGRAAQGKIRFFRPAMCGALGATAGMANILGLDAPSTRSALGIAYSQLSGTMQAHVEGSPVLPMQIGFNARAALLAVDLALRGVAGPRDFLEGPYGYYSLIDPEWDPAAFDALGSRWAVTELSHKPFPSGRATHGGVDGLLRLQAALGFRGEDLKAVRVLAPPLVRQLVDRPASADMAPAHARLCLPYVAATAALTGGVTVADFDPAALRDPRRLALATRIAVVADENSSPYALAPQRVEIRLRDGSRHALDVPAVLGAPARPLSPQSHLAKFRLAVASAPHPLTTAAADRLVGLVDRLETLDDARVLVDAMMPADDETDPTDHASAAGGRRT
jgi:aconitate decarboxylase